MPDFTEVYSFLGGVFDPSTDGHLERMQEMAPIDRETVSVYNWLITLNFKHVITCFRHFSNAYQLMIHNICKPLYCLSNAQLMDLILILDACNILFFCCSLICLIDHNPMYKCGIAFQVLLLMKNLSINLSSATFEEHVCLSLLTGQYLSIVTIISGVSFVYFLIRVWYFSCLPSFGMYKLRLSWI